MNVKDYFKDDATLNKFYTHLAGISEMALSKYANLLLTPILQETAKWVHEHKQALDKLAQVGSDLADKAAKSEQERALDKDAQKEQVPARSCQDSLAANRAAGVDCSSVCDTD